MGPTRPLARTSSARYGGRVGICPRRDRGQETTDKGLSRSLSSRAVAVLARLVSGMASGPSVGGGHRRRRRAAATARRDAVGPTRGRQGKAWILCSAGLVTRPTHPVRGSFSLQPSFSTFLFIFTASFPVRRQRAGSHSQRGTRTQG